MEVEGLETEKQRTEKGQQKPQERLEPQIDTDKMQNRKGGEGVRERKQRWNWKIDGSLQACAVCC